MCLMKKCNLLSLSNIAIAVLPMYIMKLMKKCF